MDGRAVTNRQTVTPRRQKFRTQRGDECRMFMRDARNGYPAQTGCRHPPEMQELPAEGGTSSRGKIVQEPSNILQYFSEILG